MRQLHTAMPWAISLSSTVFGGIYVLLALWPGRAASWSTSTSTLLERLSMLILILACLLTAYFKLRSKATAPAFLRFQPPLCPPTWDNAAHTRRAAPSHPAGIWWAWIKDTSLLLLPALPFLCYVYIQSVLAYNAHFLVDTDFTNISSAINHSAHGDGLLRNAFLTGGSSGSYLGHHFAPILFLFVPFYKFFHIFPAVGALLQPLPVARPTHFIYAIALWSSLALAMLVWSRVLLHWFKDRGLAVLLMLALLYQPLLWRMALSFHFEILVLLCSGLIMLAWQTNRVWLFYLSFFAWLLIKEDIAIYLTCFSIFLIGKPELSLHRHQGWWLLVICILYALIARSGLTLFADGDPIAWQSYWWPTDPAAFAHAGQSSFWTPLQYSLLAGGLLWIVFFQTRFSLLVLLPLTGLHALSSQPWHNGMLGHYGYPILPFIWMGWVLGLQGLQQWQDRLHKPLLWPVLGLALGSVFYQAAADRLTPLPAMGADKNFMPASSASDRWQWEMRLQELQPGDCIQTAPQFTAHVPLDVRVLPLQIPEKNYYHAYDYKKRIEQQAQSSEQDQQPGVDVDPLHICKSYYLLITQPGSTKPDWQKLK